MTVNDARLAFSAAPKNGRVTFVVLNRGVKPHELELSGPNGSERTLPISAGASVHLIATLVPGRYRLWDPLGLGLRRSESFTIAPPRSAADGSGGGLGAQGGAGTTAGPVPTSATGLTVTQVCDSLATGQATCVTVSTAG